MPRLDFQHLNGKVLKLMTHTLDEVLKSHIKHSDIRIFLSLWGMMSDKAQGCPNPLLINVTQRIPKSTRDLFSFDFLGPLLTYSFAENGFISN